MGLALQEDVHNPSSGVFFHLFLNFDRRGRSKNAYVQAGGFSFLSQSTPRRIMGKLAVQVGFQEVSSASLNNFQPGSMALN
jgi:hypothetical protein